MQVGEREALHQPCSPGLLHFAMVATTQPPHLQAAVTARLDLLAKRDQALEERICALEGAVRQLADELWRLKTASAPDVGGANALYEADGKGRSCRAGVGNVSRATKSHTGLVLLWWRRLRVPGLAHCTQQGE